MALNNELKGELKGSDRSPSDDEKGTGSRLATTLRNLPPDPDEGLGEAERAKIVWIYHLIDMS